MQNGMKTLMAEIEKCDLLCLMCHRTRTHHRTKHGNHNGRNPTATRRWEIMIRAKNGPCELCGSKYPHWQMDFDHLRDKISDLGCASRKLKDDQIIDEIKKCRLLCGLCHRAHTFNVSPEPMIT
jgi:hypothetical protein